MSGAQYPVFTVGHSNHSMEAFLALLKKNSVDHVADVRSSPYSRYVPHFNKNVLEWTLQKAGIAYVYLGEELGGRPADPSCYDENGQVMYNRVADTDLFNNALDLVMRTDNDHRIALMCAEKEPLECHRTLLVARALAAGGVSVEHILVDGGLESYDAAIDRLLDVFKLPLNGDMFRTRDDVVAEALTLQAKKVAYIRH